MISTGGTIAESVEALVRAGARPEITVAATHGPLLPGAREKMSHESVREVFVTDTMLVAGGGWPQMHVVSVAPLLAQALRRSAEVDARRITVTAQDGTVELWGNVRAWIEKEEAERAAWAAPGVHSVKSHISIVP